MARNYKRDTRGRFARIAGLKVKGSSKATGVRKLSSTSRAPIQQPAKGRVLVAIDNRGRVTPVSAAQAGRIRANNRRIRTGAIAGGIIGGYAGAHAGIIGVGPGAVLGSQIGAGIANRSNQRRRRR